MSQITTPANMDVYGTLNEYIIDVNGVQTTFLLKNNYVSPRYLGRGGQGRIVCAWDNLNNINVAIKQVQYTTKLELLEIQEEISILQSVKQKNNIFLLDTYHSANCSNSEGYLYLVMELMDGDLHCIRNKLDHKKLSFLLYQLITGVNYLHSKGIIHRDIKPHNVGVSRDGSLKILDFGLSCRIDLNTILEPTRVGTLHYKAPEMLLGNMYNQSADMWAVGCVAAELILKDTLFSGINESNQLETICQTLGQPDYEFLQQLDILQRTQLNYYTLDVEERVQDFNIPDELFVHNTRHDMECTEQFRDLLNKLLEFDSNKRLSSEEALNHPYFNRFSHRLTSRNI
ncbi:Mitogen-activated protein kinase 9 isoform X5 [Oopsacas minuta]|uniref:Mitogen-activated protein kinase 9 isoform X5 n=1 Tax=Oopsacas minuta TaxID=111878 RepID=A0AAV7KFU8_9METZ|nr:Mitogen-activated protein kinase 9 isoform X5 [Oopsacas minuta]